MSGGMFILRDDGEFTELAEQQYDSEAVLQALLAEHPDLLAGDQLGNAEPRRFLLIAREVSLSSDGGSHWSVDHVFLDQDAVPTIVEVKRSTSSEIRRSIVGQMLDYAANAVVYWPVEHLQANFLATCTKTERDPDKALADHVQTPEAVETFWERTRDNLQNGHVRLVFVSDDIPPELRRIIEFLNEQMSPAEVIGVEVKQYVGADLKTLVPRVVGQTAFASQKKAVSGGASRRNDWSWELYETELKIPSERIAIGKKLVEAVSAAIAARGLLWKPTFRQGFVVFHRPGQYNVVLVDLWWKKPPRMGIKLPLAPQELGLADPYPELESSWNPNEREWSWTIPNLGDIPDVSKAVDITRPFQPVGGPMPIPVDPSGQVS